MFGYCTSIPIVRVETTRNGREFNNMLFQCTSLLDVRGVAVNSRKDVLSISDIPSVRDMIKYW